MFYVGPIIITHKTSDILKGYTKKCNEKSLEFMKII